MKYYFKIIDDIKTAIEVEPFITTVTQGDITDVDLNKKVLFPLCHIMVQNAEVQENIISLNISLLLMDIEDFSKENESHDIRGNNNELDVLNTQLAVAARLHALIRKNSSWKDSYQLDSNFSCEPFKERFENNLAGWSVDFTITFQNDMTYC